MKKTLSFLCFLVFASISNLYAQTPIEDKTIELFKAQDWETLKSYTQSQLEVDTANVFDIMLLKFYWTHSLINTGSIRQSYLETEKIFNDYSDEELVDTPMVKMMINVCQKLSFEAIEAERLETGLTAVRRGFRLCKDRVSNDHRRLSDLCYNAVSVYRSVDSLDLALKYLNEGKKAAQNLESKEKRKTISMLRNEEAIIYWAQNNLKKTKTIFSEELQQAILDSNYSLQTRFHINLGITNEYLFDFGKSEYHFMKGLETNQLKKDEQELDEFLISYNLARVYSHLQRYQEQKDLLEKCLSISKNIYGEDSPRIGGVYLALGNSYAKQKMYTKAKYYYDKNLENLKVNYPKESTRYTDKLSDYGGILIAQNEVDEGIKYVLESVKNRLNLNLNYDPLQSNSYMHLTSAYLKKNNLEKAEEYLNKSISSVNYDYDKNDYDFNKINVPMELVGPLYMYYEYLNALTETGNNELSQEVDKLDNLVDTLVKHIKFNFEDLSSRKIFVRDMQPLYQSRLELYDRIYKSDENIIAKAFNLSERSKNTFLYEVKAEKSNNSNAITNAIYNKRQKLKGRIENIKSQLKGHLTNNENIGNNITDSLSLALTSAQNDHYKLIQNIKDNNPGYYSYVYDYPITTIKEVQEKLDQDEVVIIFTSSFKDQLAITITNQSKSFHNLGAIDTIKQAANEFIAYCRNPKQQTNFDYNLHDLLIKPLDITQKKVHFILDGVLSMVPFEAIPNDNDEYLVQKYNISYNYSATLIEDKNNNRLSNGSVLAMAPVFSEEDHQYETPKKQYFAEVIRSGKIIPLPGSLEEVEAIDEILGGKILTKHNATKSAFMNNVKGKSIIHLATHGIINELEPSLSGLMFYSEDKEPQELLVSDIIQMDLDADLVTLSACNTGSGKIINGEGVSSLGRAFSYAGCSNQSLSLWSVNDKTTTELMSYFYSNLKEGQTKPTALTNAKKQYINSAPEILKHPYYWAGFVYYGSDTTINRQTYSLGLGVMLGIGLLLLVLGFLFKNRTT